MATEITLSIPDEHVSTILDTFNKLASANIELLADKHDYSGRWNFSYSPKGSEETARDFAKRVILEHVKAMVRLVDYAEDQDRYSDAVAEIPRPEQDVPDDIIG